MTSQPAVPQSTPAPRRYKILVAAAFDATCDDALFEGINLALHNPASELHVVHAVGPGGLTLPATSHELDDAADELRDRIEAAWEHNGAIDVIAHVRPGSPPETILQAAIDIGADVIIVGSHRRTGLKRFILGSVAEHVLREAHCPVLLAVPKDYSGTSESPRIAPPCEDCLAVRKASQNVQYWCERHSRPYLQPHVYVPRDQGRSSVLPTY